MSKPKFFKSIESLWEDPELELSDIAVMSVIVTVSQYKIAKLSYTDITSRLRNKVAKRTVIDCIKKLERLQYIEVTRQQAPLPNIYHVKNLTRLDPDIEKYKVLINKF